MSAVAAVVNTRRKQSFRGSFSDNLPMAGATGTLPVVQGHPDPATARPDASRAAACLQAHWRGHQTRREMAGVLAAVAAAPVHTIFRISASNDLIAVDRDDALDRIKAKVAETIERRRGYASLFTFLVFTCLFFAILFLENAVSVPFGLRLSVLEALVLDENLADDDEVFRQTLVDDPANRGKVIFDWLSTTLVPQIWADPVCGDGVCAPNVELPAFGRFGCAEDCGFYDHLSTVGIQIDAMFYSDSERQQAEWNLCTSWSQSDGAQRTECFYAEDQTFQANLVAENRTISLPDGEWYIDLNTYDGGVGFLVGTGSVSNPYSTVLLSMPRCSSTGAVPSDESDENSTNTAGGDDDKNRDSQSNSSMGLAPTPLPGGGRRRLGGNTQETCERYNNAGPGCDAQNDCIFTITSEKSTPIQGNCDYFTDDGSGDHCTGIEQIDMHCMIRDNKGCFWQTEVNPHSCEYEAPQTGVPCAKECGLDIQGDGLCHQECNIAVCAADSGDCCDKADYNDKKSNTFNLTTATAKVLRSSTATTTTAATNLPKLQDVLFDDAIPRERFLGPRIHLMGGMLVSQIRNVQGVCGTAARSYNASTSSIFLDLNALGCAVTPGENKAAFGYDAAFTSTAPTVYNPDLFEGAFYNVSDPAQVRNLGSVPHQPYAFLPFNAEPHHPDWEGKTMFPVFFDANLRNDLALQVVERMQSGSFMDNLTAAVMVDVPAYSKEAQVFFVLHVGFTWDEYGLIHTELSMDGFCPVYTESANVLTALVLIFIIALGINLVVEALQARRMGLCAYFADFSNWLDLASTGNFAYLLGMWYKNDQVMRAFVPKAQYPVYEDNLALANVFALRDHGKVLENYVNMLGDAIDINDARTGKDLVMVIGISLVVSARAFDSPPQPPLI